MRQGIAASRRTPAASVPGLSYQEIGLSLSRAAHAVH
jgi:hypothetical protein